MRAEFCCLFHPDYFSFLIFVLVFVLILALVDCCCLMVDSRRGGESLRLLLRSDYHSGLVVLMSCFNFFPLLVAVIDANGVFSHHDDLAITSELNTLWISRYYSLIVIHAGAQQKLASGR